MYHVARLSGGLQGYQLSRYRAGWMQECAALLPPGWKQIKEDNPPLQLGLEVSPWLLELGATTKGLCPLWHSEHLLYVLFLRCGTH